ncbi:zinc knuckle CX2CX4HX4C containing protein [Tanacetum coccineum]|uniref:Zinc knuckle CX2CX4HX4C containing protein n=1 Tax=Tanacetum coccineum TaxID=301880 RepID=A0ABQ5HXI9_9ASTR
MNPETGDTMKHRSMLGRSSQVNFRERVTRSSSRGIDSASYMDEEGLEEGNLKSGGDGNGVCAFEDGVSKAGNVSDLDEAELIFGSVCKDPKVSLNANVSDKPGVNVNSASVNDIPMSNSGLGSSGSGFVPGMLVPFDENPMLNPNAKGSQSTNGKGLSLNEVKVPGMFKIIGDGSMLKKGVGSVSNFEVGDQNSAGRGLSNNGGLRQSVSFARREVAVMDPVLEEGIDKWSMTVCVIENGPWMVENKPLFVRKWEPGLCMSKPDTSKLPLWVKIYDIPLEAWNVEGISRIASRIGVPIIMDKITTLICEKPYGRASYARVLVEVDVAKGLVDSVEIWYKGLGKSMILNVEYGWRPFLFFWVKGTLPR